MKVSECELRGVKLIEPVVYKDERGFFLESYHRQRYQAAGINVTFVQDNHSLSAEGTLRGMHFQSTPGQAKLVRVVQGRIFDVVVDIRPESPTFGGWRGFELDAQQHHQLFIPVGFAHGFCVLSEAAQVLYKCSSPYEPSTEKGFRFDDPDVGIEWPVKNPILSKRDASAPYLADLQLRKPS